jgi:hypothetical protein
VIVYGARHVNVGVPAFLRSFATQLGTLPETAAIGQIVDWFVDFAEVYSAAADTILDDENRPTPPFDRWAAAADALADAVCGAWAGDPRLTAQGLSSARRAIASIPADDWKAPLAVKPAEGFAQYGLYPEQYALAGTRVARTFEPARLACLGIRSIGLPLAHVVSAGARMAGVTTTVVSVRPRGHPFDRTASLGPLLRDQLTSFAPDLVAVVDEGPGLSGSSFASAVDALVEAGVDVGRIVLIASWNAPESALRSSRGRAVWRTHAKVVVALEEAAPDLPGSRPRLSTVDLSAGGWRVRLLPPDRWPAVQPQHERTKFLVDEGGGKTVLRFAGLGHHGRRAMERAAILADSGFGAVPLGLDRGFLALEWLEGTPLLPAAPVEGSLSDRVADYLAFIKRRFGSDRPDDLVELEAMIDTNLSEDRPVAGEAPPVVHRVGTATVEPCERCAIDGRLFRHEWVRSGGRILKVDALDHHADDFFPGCRDIAWDVAAAIIELELGDQEAAALVERYRQTSGDREIVRRIDFYRLAYVAWRIGYATLAAETLGASEDGGRFRADLTKYRRLLAAPAG